MSQKNKSNTGRAAWTSEQFNLFVEVCVKGTNLGKRSGGGWGDKGWLWVENEMKIAGAIFTKEQLKHKWDWMKDQWKLWKDLIGKETGIGWDPVKGTIAASNEWWNEKIQENSSFARFREKGIGQELYEKYQIIFMSTVATGEYAYAPSSGILPDLEELQSNIHVEQTIDLEESFDDQLDQMMSGGESFSQFAYRTIGLENIEGNDSQLNRSTQKRKESSTNDKTKKKKEKKGKKISGTDQVTNIVKELKEGIQESMEKKTTALCGVLRDRPGCSIEEVMEDVLSLPQMTVASDIHFFSTLLLNQNSKREMYNTRFRDKMEVA